MRLQGPSPIHQDCLTRRGKSVTQSQHQLCCCTQNAFCQQCLQFQQVLRKNVLSPRKPVLTQRSLCSSKAGPSLDTTDRLAWTQAQDLDRPQSGGREAKLPTITSNRTCPVPCCLDPAWTPAHLHALQECLGVLDALGNTLLILWQGFQFLHQGL